MGKIKKAVIPAAGYGTRFLPITKVVPKELLPIGKKPAIQYVVEEAVASGIEEIVLVCHPHKLSIADYFRSDQRLNSFLAKKNKWEEIEDLKKIESMAEFHVIYQEEALGLGHAVLCAQEALGKDPFLVLLPDVLVTGRKPATRQLMELYSKQGGWGALVERVSWKKLSSYGIIGGPKVGKDVWRIEKAIEKPLLKEAPSDLALMGRYLFPPDIFSILEKTRSKALGEIQLTDAIDVLAKKEAGWGSLCMGTIFDIGTPIGMLRAAKRLNVCGSLN